MISAWGIDHGEPVEKSVLGAFSGLAKGTARGFKAGRSLGFSVPASLKGGLGRGVRGAAQQLIHSKPGGMVLRRISAGPPKMPSMPKMPTATKPRSL